ncbi:hypothetical protein PR202_ga06413 [Eleusine coracana subsp. coracana]|uniref:Uncharacterized protein n=1 Tax=Eleusine coracana subsp. coracana TaxID=191504 RepID=A0AAV5BX75_ELECO|nr:hypothetical protein PR202_ga06413 [Eleusine coracana subsp. coracana]
MNVGQAAHLSGQMSGQGAQMNQVGGSGVGVGGADGLPQHQPMQDVVGLGGIDAQFVMLRNSMREKMQIALSSDFGTMIPMPGMTQGSSGNTRIPYVTDNNALSSTGAGMAQNANMGTSMQGSMSNGYPHLPNVREVNPNVREDGEGVS